MPILNPDYDPDWEARFDRAKNRVDKTHDQKHLTAMHHAFWCRYRTMAEIRDFHIDATKRRADAHALEITLIPHIDDDCTWDDISAVYNLLNDAIDEYLCRGGRPPYEHPEGLNAFFEDSDAQRFTEYYQYDGFWHPSACHLTIEFQENGAYVCFTLLPSSGTSPVNMIEELATKVYKDELFERYEPHEVNWYTYHRFSGTDGHEGFMQAMMPWDERRKEYGRVVEWRHFTSIPVSIVKTTVLDDADRPEPLVRPRQHLNNFAQETDIDEG
jgi:hypothetical protein